MPAAWQFSPDLQRQIELGVSGNHQHGIMVTHPAAVHTIRDNCVRGIELIYFAGSQDRQAPQDGEFLPKNTPGE